ncbi:MAG: DUF4363 family protein [Desulfotomaculaceae bacterium]
MKVYIAVAGMVLFLLVMSVYTLQAFSDTAAQMSGGIDRLESDVLNSDWTGAANKVEAIKEDWDKYKQWWAVFIDHQEIDNIDMALARAEKFIVTQERALAAGELAVLRLMLEHIPEKEQINLKNVF